MPQRVQKIIDKVLEWWKKFNTKTRIIMVSAAAVVVVAIVILAVVVSRPNMELLVTCENTTESASVKDLLETEGIDYEISDDGLSFYVDEEDQANASILLGSNGVPTSSPSIDDVFDGGFSSTEADKTKRYKEYLQSYYAEQLEMLSVVEKASVTLDIPDDDGTILSRNEESYAAVILTLNGTMDEDQAAGVARYMATQLGNDSTDNITILDSDMNVLFSGGDSDSTTGAASSQLALREKTENNIKNAVRDVMVGSSLFDHVEVASKLDMNFDSLRETEVQYSAPDGQTNGMVSEQSTYESESVGGVAGTPGTDSNGDDTTYVMEDNDYTSSTVTDQTTTYQNNSKVTDRTAAIGTINYDDSSIAIVAKNYVLYDEDALKDAGALDDMTFDEYIAANSDPVRIDVDDDYYTLVANATGFPVASISIIAYDEPVFQYSSSGHTVSDFLPIILAILILLLLGYVVFRSTRKEKETETEPELSVESLLASTKESQENLEDIGYNEKSESRMQIEKFIQDNPEAAASLLRNWLNSDWE